MDNRAREDLQPLLGDAAHVMHPTGSNGASQAVVPPAEREAFMARYKAAAGLAIEALNSAALTIAPGSRVSA